MPAKKPAPKPMKKAPAKGGKKAPPFGKGGKGAPAAKPMKGGFGKMMNLTGLDKSNV